MQHSIIFQTSYNYGREKVKTPPNPASFLPHFIIGSFCPHLGMGDTPSSYKRG